jgi:hypothetical protein
MRPFVISEKQPRVSLSRLLDDCSVLRKRRAIANRLASRQALCRPACGSGCSNGSAAAAIRPAAAAARSAPATPGPAITFRPSSTAARTARATCIRSASGASRRRPRPTCTRSRGAIAGGSATPGSRLPFARARAWVKGSGGDSASRLGGSPMAGSTFQVCFRRLRTLRYTRCGRQ